MRLEGVTVLADDVAGFGRFLREGLGFTLDVEEEHYLATNSPPVRLAVFSRPGMLANTGDHPDYARPRAGQSFELNFECADPAEVRSRLGRIASHGGTVIADPVETSWGHFTAFFADPEGNIHSLFAVLPATQE